MVDAASVSRRLYQRGEEIWLKLIQPAPDIVSRTRGETCPTEMIVTSSTQLGKRRLEAAASVDAGAMWEVGGVV